MKKKTYLVTGGSRGIGRETVRALRLAGHKVAFIYKNDDAAASSLQKESGAVPLKCDLSNLEFIEQTVKDGCVLLETSGFDGVVCCCGISRIGLFTDMTMNQWEEIRRINLESTMEVIRCVLPYMITKKAGSIVTVASMWGQIGASCEVTYSTTKAAIIGLTKSLSKEVGPSGIRVNCVSPGLIDTDMNKNISKEELESFCRDIPLERMGTAKEVADAIIYLLSENASYITGQTLSVNGGFVC